MKMVITANHLYDPKRLQNMSYGKIPLRVEWEDDSNLRERSYVLIQRGDFILMAADTDEYGHSHGDAITCYPCWCKKIHAPGLNGVGLEVKNFMENPRALRDFLTLHENCTHESCVFEKERR